MGDKITGEKNPILALFLNLCCGMFALGYFYTGQWQKALAVIGINVVLGILGIFTFGITGIPSLVLWIFCTVDAYSQANQLKMGKSIGHWTFFSSTI